MEEKKWKPAFWLIVGFGIGDGVLALLGYMTVSQLAYDAGQRNPWYIWGTGVFFVWLFVHLFWRWKRVFSWLKGFFRKEK